jgi:HEAT repeat protein
MKSNSSAGPRDGLRPKVLWPVAVALAVVIFALLIPKRSLPPAKHQAEAVATPTTAANPAPPHTVPLSFPSPASEKTEMEPETARQISILFDKSLSLQFRRPAARALAKIGTDEAMAALKTVLTNDTPRYLKAAVAEGLGQCPNPEARDLLNELVNGKDEITARGAARGLASRGDSDAVDTLGGLLFNDQTSLSVRTEAALALGDVDLPGAQDLLTRAVTQIEDDDVRESVLDGLGRRPLSETEEFFRNYLNSPDVPPESKVLAIESVTDAEGDVTSFLTNYLNDPNPDVRGAAKSAVDSLNPMASAGLNNVLPPAR